MEEIKDPKREYQLCVALKMYDDFAINLAHSERVFKGTLFQKDIENIRNQCNLLAAKIIQMYREIEGLAPDKEVTLAMIEEKYMRYIRNIGEPIQSEQESVERYISDMVKAEDLDQTETHRER